MNTNLLFYSDIPHTCQGTREGQLLKIFCVLSFSDAILSPHFHGGYLISLLLLLQSRQAEDDPFFFCFSVLVCFGYYFFFIHLHIFFLFFLL